MSQDITLHKSSVKGDRPTNEDVERYYLNLSIDGKPINPEHAPIDLFIICDGHGGSQVAEFVAPCLEKYLLKPKLKYPLPHHYIVKIYNFIQQKLIEHPQRIANNCGCTALVMIRFSDNQENKKIQVINIGDCRAILSRNGLAIPLSKDHKPNWSDEKRRIDMVNRERGTNRQVRFNCGDWRIGDLSVSRSFGDLDNTPYVTHIPDSYCYQLINDDEFVVLCCDGCTDVLSNHEIVNFVRDHLHNNHTELYHVPRKYQPKNFDVNQTNIARKLADYCLAKGSSDNVSIMIVVFEKK